MTTVFARSGTTPSQRDRNLALVLGALREHGPASRSELASRLGLDRSTLTHLADVLLRVGLVVETDGSSVGSRGGRRPRPLVLNPDRFVTLGVDIRAKAAEWALVRLDGTVRQTGSVDAGSVAAVRLGERGWHRAAAAIVTDSVMAIVRAEPLRLVGAGISVPGIVDRDEGVLLRSLELGLESEPILRYWQELNTPLLIDNDANCCAWNVVADPKGPRNVVLCQMTVHTDDGGRFLPSGAGIGFAFVLNGHIYYGAHGAAGELRGLRWTSSSPDQLGSRLERVRGSRGEQAAYRDLASEVLGNLSVVASVIDPDRVILTGEVERISGHVSHLMRGELRHSAIAGLAESGSLAIAPINTYPAAAGAARMVLSHLFAIPGSEPSGPPTDLRWGSIMSAEAGVIRGR